MGLHDDIDAAAPQGDEPGGFVIEELQFERFQAGRDVLLAPFQQDALLIGAAADAEAQAGCVLRLLDCLLYTSRCV